MQVGNGITYDSVYARAAAYFIGTCAPKPKESEHKAAYALITGIYSLIAADPESIGYKFIADTHFAPWEQQKGREKDIKSIRGSIDKIEKLIAELFLMSKTMNVTGDVAELPLDYKLGRTFTKTLEKMDITLEKQENGLVITAPEGCLKGLKELAEISKQHVIPITDGPKEDKEYLLFSRCVFQPEENWTAQAFDKLLDANGNLVSLCVALEKRGYRRVDCFEGKKISIDYVKQHGKKEEPLKLAWGERTHSGISVTYEELRREPAFLWVRMPMFRTVLANMDKLPEDVNDFIFNYTKTCDGCRYCIQTDKTGTRPLACVDIRGVAKCPNYPGFTMNFRNLTPELSSQVLSVLDAINNIL